MNNPLHAAFYADEARQCVAVQIIENRVIARDTMLVRFACPEIASRVIPGQFVMLRLAGLNDPLIGRPLALYDTFDSDAGEPQGIDVVYLVKGKMTQRLAQWTPGQTIDVWGPLGNGFQDEPVEHLIMVAGGIGQTPFMALAQQFLGHKNYGGNARRRRAERVTLCYGARSADLLAGVADFEQLGVEVQIATDDGTRGHHGLVTDLVARLLADSSTENGIVCCGPEPMMESVAAIAADQRTPCQVSLETPMACGVGICFTCVARVRDAAGGWDYKRTCVDGPVFDAQQIEWA